MSTKAHPHSTIRRRRVHGVLITVTGLLSLLVSAGPAQARPPCGMRGSLDRLEPAGGDRVRFCMDTQPRTCWTVDLQTGRYQRAPLQPASPDAQSRLGTATTIAVCPPGVTPCKALPKPRGYAAHVVTADGRQLLVATTTHQRTSTRTPTWIHLHLYSVATLKRLRTRRNVGRVEDEVNALDLTNLGPTVLLDVAPCAGPCSHNWLIAPRTLRRIASLGLPGGANPTPVGGTVYAFTDGLEPKQTAFVDVATGRHLATVRWWPVVQRLLGTRVTFSPGELRSVASATGRVGLFLQGAVTPPRDGDVITFSRQQRQPRLLRFPACPGPAPR